MNIEKYRVDLLNKRIQVAGRNASASPQYNSFTGNMTDIKKLLEFDNELKAKNYKPDTRKNYLVTISKLIRFLKGKPFSRITKQTLIEFYNYLKEKEKLAELTINSYKMRVSHYFLWLNGGKEYPESVADLKAEKIRKIKLPENIPTEEDIQKLIATAKTVREKCIIFMLYETGARRNEFLNLRIGDLAFDSIGCKVSIKTEKNGNDRIVRIVDSVPLIKLHLKQHRNANDQNAWLWYVGNSTKRLSEMGITSMFHRLTIRAGLGKEIIDNKGNKRLQKIHPHLLRHRRITEWVKKGISESMIRYLSGWSVRSNMIEVYNHFTKDDVDIALLEKVYDKRIKDRKESRPVLQTISCNRCNQENSYGLDYCSKCYNPLSETANYQIDIVKELIGRVLEKAWATSNPKGSLPEIIEKLGEIKLMENK